MVGKSAGFVARVAMILSLLCAAIIRGTDFKDAVAAFDLVGEFLFPLTRILPTVAFLQMDA